MSSAGLRTDETLTQEEERVGEFLEQPLRATQDPRKQGHPTPSRRQQISIDSRARVLNSKFCKYHFEVLWALQI